MKARTAIPKKRRGPPRRGRVVDKKYLGFIHTFPCLVEAFHVCKGRITAHHVRRFGEQKNDRRAVPLCESAHLHDFGELSIERIGKKRFVEHYAVDIEAAIVELNQRYQQERAA